MGGGGGVGGRRGGVGGGMGLTATAGMQRYRFFLLSHQAPWGMKFQYRH